MSGTKMGSIKAKLGLKGQTKPGEMISRMNKMKSESMAHEMKESPAKERSEKKIIKKII